MIYYHPKWLQQPFRDNRGNFIYQLNSAEITELHEVMVKFLSMGRIAINWEQIVKKLR